MKYIYVLIVLVALLNSCGNARIETSETLSHSDIEYIKNLKLLDNDEKIFKFYSEYKNRVAGNFYTNKRVAEYWIDERDKNTNQINSAFYKEIKSIDTVYYAGLTYSPYMLITKMDNSQFKVSVDGTKEEIKIFFEGAIEQWKQYSSKN
jgi:hypothetical protein